MAGANLETIRSMIAMACRPLVNRLDNYVQRAVIREVDDALKGQQVKLDLGGEDRAAGIDAVTVEQVESFEPYGITANPPAGTECLLISVGGASDNPVAIGVVNRDQRPKDMNAGEVAVYGTAGVGLFYDDAGTVYLANRTAAEFIARADRTDAALATLQDAHDNHTHVTTATVSSGSPGVLQKTAAPVGSLSSVAADKVKGE